MRYCKNCHILYSSFADACPKCGIKPAKAAESEEAPGDKKRVRNDWLFILFGIPVLIGLLYLIALFIRSLG